MPLDVYVFSLPIAMTKLTMKEGYTIVAEGAYCLAVSPSKLIYRFKIAALGLLALVPGVPKVLSATSGTPNPIRTASECSGVDRLPITSHERACL